MDVLTFEKSAAAISPFIAKMFSEGISHARLVDSSCDEILFKKIRQIGVQAEKAMFSATNGVNTHKGIIFTLGIIAASLGFTVLKNPLAVNVDQVLENAKKMTSETLEKDFAAMAEREPKTHGEKLYALYGERGIRGEAQKGFPIIRNVAFPYFVSLKDFPATPECRNIMLLFKIISNLSDTNVLTRSSPATLSWLQKKSSELLSKIESENNFSDESLKELQILNAECIEKNISPGGSADILAVTLFLFKALSPIQL